MYNAGLGNGPTSDESFQTAYRLFDESTLPEHPLAEYCDINCAWREYSNVSDEHPETRGVDETLLPTKLTIPN